MSKLKIQSTLRPEQLMRLLGISKLYERSLKHAYALPLGYNRTRCRNVFCQNVARSGTDCDGPFTYSDQPVHLEGADCDGQLVGQGCGAIKIEGKRVAI